MRTKTAVIAVATFVVMVITMILPTNTSAQTTEDDGYTYPDGASEEEKDQIDEQEQQAWEEAGRPGDNDNNDNDNDSDQPYCDEVDDDYRGTCWDRKDYSDSTGLYPCKNGQNLKDWRDCPDSEENTNNDNNNGDGGSRSNTQPQTQPPLSGTLIDDIAFCKRVGQDDARNGTPFDSIAFDECPNDVYGQNSYLAGFMDGSK